jgi:serine/threonine-protein kinase
MFTPEDVAKIVGEEAAAIEEAEQEEDRLVGTLMRDKWRVLKRLGAGSFGTVYKVEDVKGGWIEALKILGVDRLTGAEAEEMRARFLREAQIMKRLGKDSKHIVGLSTYEEDIEAGLIYFLMEYVEGPSLADALSKDGPFSVERTVKIALQACDALMAAHEGPEPVVHRDLKLENLMLMNDRSGEEMVKVLDFGIAKIAEREADSRLTTVGTLGTPGYAAPEQLRAEAVDGRTDLFAFGVILYALLTGKDPWLGNLAHEPTHQIYELMVATDRAKVRPIDESGVTIPPAMVNVVMKLLRRDPDQRFQSARELRDTLLRLSEAGGFAETGSTSVAKPAGEPSTSSSPERSQPSRPKPPQKRKSRAGRLVAAFIVLAAVGATAWAQPWGRTLDLDGLLARVQSGTVAGVWLTDDGLEGGIQVVPIDALADVKTPFFVDVAEGDIPETVTRLREAGATVDVSWEERRLMDLAMAAQSRNRYFGVEGGR